jgi:hypothetical protein
VISDVFLHLKVMTRANLVLHGLDIIENKYVFLSSSLLLSLLFQDDDDCCGEFCW